MAALQVAKNSQVIMIAVKPQYVGTVLEEIKDILTDEHIIVSIAAGIPLSAMKVSRSLCSCIILPGPLLAVRVHPRTHQTVGHDLRTGACFCVLMTAAGSLLWAPWGLVTILHPQGCYLHSLCLSSRMRHDDLGACLTARSSANPSAGTCRS